MACPLLATCSQYHSRSSVPSVVWRPECDQFEGRVSGHLQNHVIDSQTSYSDQRPLGGPNANCQQDPIESAVQTMRAPRARTRLCQSSASAFGVIGDADVVINGGDIEITHDH